MSTSTLLFIPAVTGQVQADYGWHMHDGTGAMMGYGWQGWGIAHGIFWLVILVAVVVITLALVRRLGSDDSKRNDSPRPTALEVLDERYARGEIDREEYLQRKKDLGAS
ncbi:SHOCT domain-containing protein [Novosphingobium mangrovi (ex Huang et al. 2023)]|uniref:SHOCT domain-containing protein n=1 Tax=Novosphingobium mangrovi (ex Huang et al. 2023) TaxID=2976432 RepID=A0ABT2HZZ5_9SPHN|nr:SHOCT domain-containing protein [Novosphingobium mangrovi (ex Huang et al. 2023)]MCT2398116.1 SHOCT domain-containing protein [Novosphingobium mangrovi (ex Huang et al. 2023)]